MATNGERGGLQPTPEECNPLVFLRGLKDKVEYLIVQMEDILATNPTSTSALWRRIKNLDRDWTNFEAQYLEGHPRAEDAINNCQHRSGSGNCSKPPRKP